MYIVFTEYVQQIEGKSLLEKCVRVSHIESDRATKIFDDGATKILHHVNISPKRLFGSQKCGSDQNKMLGLLPH